MKKAVLFIILIIGFNNYAQKTVYLDSYNLSYFKESPPFKIEVSAGSDNKPIFWIEVQSQDAPKERYFIKVEAKYIPLFKEVISKPKEKYAEWRKVAIENEVTNMTKRIKTRHANFAVKFKYYDDYILSKKTLIGSTFLVIENELNPLLLISNTYKLQSVTNQFVTNDGFLLPFSSEEEIDLFLNTLSVEKAEKAIKELINTESLFH